MKHIVMEMFVIDYSNECYEAYRKPGQNDYDLSVKLRQHSWIDYHSVLKITHEAGLYPQTMRMLEAHGVSGQDKYTFADLIDGEYIYKPVEEWIDLHEKSSDVLYVCVCNNDGHILQPRKSILIYPNSAVQGLEVYLEAEGKGRNILTIVPPNK